MIIAPILRTICRYLGLAALGAGVVLGVNYCRDKSARDAIEAKREVAANAVAIDTATAVVDRRDRVYQGSAAAFLTAGARARATPGTAATTIACYERGATVISNCDSVRAANDTLKKLLARRAELMEDEAVRARRGKFFAPFIAGGWEPLKKLPAGRLGADLNFSDRWSVTGTFDEAVRFKKDSTGKLKTSFEPAAFVGLKYSFGGRR